MPLIEGVGDEVVQFLVIIIILAVAVLAWWSTNARVYRTVFVMRSSRPPPAGVRVTLRTQYSGNQLVSSTISARRVRSRNNTDAEVVPEPSPNIISEVYTPENVTSTNEEAETSGSGEPAASNEQIREMDSIVNAMEADVTPGCNYFNRSSGYQAVRNRNDRPNASENTEDDTNANTNADNADSSPTSEGNNAQPEESIPVDNSDGKIRIKLKYLNDTLKLVDGNLNELLKDFKWRHFSRELTAALRVRLIFNGHVLEDSATLLQCGLHDHAVVHCLVHPGNRGQIQQQAQQRAYPAEVVPDPEVVNEAPQERAWDLENVLMTLVSVALTVVWFFRCEYSNMFTASASVALFGLTVFYSVAIFGLYLSDNHRHVQN